MTVLLAVIVVAACSGQIDPDVLASRVATSTAVAAATDVARAEETATSVASDFNSQATTLAGSYVPGTSVTATPVGGEQSTVLATATPRPVVVRATPTPTPIPSPTPVVAPTPTALPVVGAPGDQGGPQDAASPTATPEPYSPAVFGPFAGAIPHLQNDDDAERYELEITTRDFYATGVFENPYPTSQRGWSIGYWLRVQRKPGIFWNRGFAFPSIENRGIVVAVTSEGRWDVFYRMAAFAEQGTNLNDVPIASGYTGVVKTGDSDSNALSVSVNGDTGFLLINGTLVGEFDMSAASWVGDLVPLTGIFNNDEFASVSTVFHSLVISETSRVIEATLETGLGTLAGGAVVSPFDEIDGDFFSVFDFPVTTPAFSGPWSWSVGLHGTGENVVVIVASDQLVTVAHGTGSGDDVSSSTVFDGHMSIVERDVDATNRLLVTLVNGHLELQLNGYLVAALELDEPGAFDVETRAFVRGESSSNNAVVTLGSASIWQPVQQGAATE